MQGRVGVSLIVFLFSFYGAANAQDLLTTTSPEDLVRSLTPGEVHRVEAVLKSRTARVG